MPSEVAFGEAVGAFTLAMALRDGAEVSAERARSQVTRVAHACADGIPGRPIEITFDFVGVDVQGYARALAIGGY